MIKNTFFSLSPDSGVRLDALNSIKYTLLLDYNIEISDQRSENIIESIMDACQECCRGLFSEDKKMGLT